SSSASITDPPIFHTKHRPGSREAIAQLLMKEREAEYTRLHNYRLIFCGTWNVNGQPVAADLNEWLSPQKDDDPPDVYVLGLQEMDLSKNVYIFTESAKEDEWLFKFQSALHKKAHYKLVRCVRLVAIMLVVYVRDSVERHLRDICFESVGTGFFGTMGNKGGVAVRFKLRETSVCFINSHLAAHTEECERRNQDFRDINTRLFFRLKNQFISISEHDIVFWIGDLNYRISDIDTEDVKRMCSSGAYEDLLNFDQLSREMILKKVFFDFKEGAITFPPTFKYDPGTDEWDSSEKARTPAWCDRILWRGDNVRQICYRSHMQLKLSDHKPVSSVFIIGTKEFKREMEKQVRESVIKLLDQEENEFLPQVSLNMTDVYFKNLKYLDSQQQSLTIENIGQVPVKFKFINKPSDAYFCKPWLQVQPSEGFIHIGEKFIIQLEVQINSKSVPDWSSDKIEDILVLHLEGGKDFFITVSGSCLPSFFGLPLTKLVHMLKPVGLNKSRSEEPITKETDKSLGVPKELWFLVDYLYQRGMDQENLFQMLGLESEIKVIRDVLDETITGLSASTFHIHSVAETLLIFLDSLPTPVIPNNFYQECLNATSVQSCLRVSEATLPVAHKNVFRYVCAFLREYLSHSDKNKSDVRILGLFICTFCLCIRWFVYLHIYISFFIFILVYQLVSLFVCSYVCFLLKLYI
ncbi:hypothetical protein HELRODRAFT_67935, partial [Helobdella robusta]|uniref:phosphoinositide 5-phosphatase n=1 Tax=Helobdella robusta TaxID=6412 RepID=T1FZ81_HELRO